MGELSRLRNIGATLERRLNGIGIYDRSDLANTGPARAYRLMSARHPGGHLPVCYNLYSLAAALQDRDWRELTAAEKRSLLLQAGV